MNVLKCATVTLQASGRTLITQRKKLSNCEYRNTGGKQRGSRYGIFGNNQANIDETIKSVNIMETVKKNEVHNNENIINMTGKSNSSYCDNIIPNMFSGNIWNL